MAATVRSIVRQDNWLIKTKHPTTKSLHAATTENVGEKQIDHASQGLSRQHKSVDSPASDTMDDRKRTSSTTGGGCCGDEFMTWHANDEELETGLWGPDGIIASPNVKTVLCLAVVSQIMYIGFEDVYPLWALSTPAVGGLGWGSMEIGNVLITAGLVLLVSQLVLVPCLLKSFGPVTWQRMGCLVSVPVFVSIPFATFLSWNASSLFVVSVSSITFANYAMSALNTALVVASTSMVPAGMRGKLSGLFSMAESVGKTLGPAAYAITFAWSISPSTTEWVDCHFIFYASAITMLVMTAVGWKSLTLENMILPAEGGGNGESRAVVDNGQFSLDSLSFHRARGKEVDLV